jgi:hypothetical protein
MLKKIARNKHFFTAVNFVGILAVITVFCTEESTPGQNFVALTAKQFFGARCFSGCRFYQLRVL